MSFMQWFPEGRTRAVFREIPARREVMFRPVHGLVDPSKDHEELKCGRCIIDKMCGGVSFVERIYLERKI
jgi:hypothetical protein